MKEILIDVFPEFLDPSMSEELDAMFFKPLFALLRGTGQNKNAVASASYCLRYLVQFLTEHHPELVTRQFAAKFTNLAIKRNIIQTHFVDTLRDLMRHFGDGIQTIART